MVELIKNIIKILFLLVLGWVLLHLFATVGIFLILIYIVVGMLFWNHLPEILKEKLFRKSEGDREKIDRSSKSRVLIQNFAMLLVVTLISLGALILEVRFLKNFRSLIVNPDVIFVMPPASEYKVDQIFPMEIRIQEINVPINAVQADLKFDPNLLEVVDISIKDSFSSIFLQKEINNELGYLRISGGLPSPGYSEKDGVFGVIYFKGKAPGNAKVEYLPTSLVLMNDGHGTNLLNSYISTSYQIVPSGDGEPFETKAEVVGENSRIDQVLLYDETNVLSFDATNFSKGGDRAKVRDDRWFVKNLRWLVVFDEKVLEFWKIQID